MENPNTRYSPPLPMDQAPKDREILVIDTHGGFMVVQTTGEDWFVDLFSKIPKEKLIGWWPLPGNASWGANAAVGERKK